MMDHTPRIPVECVCSFCYICGKEFDVFALEPHECCSSDSENSGLIEELATVATPDEDTNNIANNDSETDASLDSSSTIVLADTIDDESPNDGSPLTKVDNHDNTNLINTLATTKDSTEERMTEIDSTAVNSQAITDCIDLTEDCDPSTVESNQNLEPIGTSQLVCIDLTESEECDSTNTFNAINDTIIITNEVVNKNPPSTPDDAHIDLTEDTKASKTLPFDTIISNEMDENSPTADLTEKTDEASIALPLDTINNTNEVAENPPTSEEPIDLTEQTTEASTALPLDNADNIDTAYNELLCELMDKGVNKPSNSTKQNSVERGCPAESNNNALNPQQDCPTPPIYCEFCGIPLVNNAELSSHKESHGEHSFVCFVCGDQFENTSELMFHHKMQHYQSDIRYAELKHMNVRSKYRYFCNQCGEGFNFIHALMEHKKLSIQSKKHVLEQELKVVLNDGICPSNKENTLPPQDRNNKKPKENDINVIDTSISDVTSSTLLADDDAEPVVINSDQAAANDLRLQDDAIVNCELCGIPIENNILLLHYKMSHHQINDVATSAKQSTATQEINASGDVQERNSIEKRHVGVKKIRKRNYSKKTSASSSARKPDDAVTHVGKKIDGVQRNHNGFDRAGEQISNGKAKLTKPGKHPEFHNLDKKRDRRPITKKAPDNTTKKNGNNEARKVLKDTFTKYIKHDKSSDKNERNIKRKPISTNEGRIKTSPKHYCRDTPLNQKHIDCNKYIRKRYISDKGVISSNSPVNKDKRKHKLPLKQCDIFSVNTISNKKQYFATKSQSTSTISSKESHEKPKKILTYEQYKQRRRSSLDSDSHNINIALETNDNNNAAASSTTSAPTVYSALNTGQERHPTEGYSPKEMDIINEVSHKVTQLNAHRDSADAQFSDEPDADESCSDGAKTSSFCEACGQPVFGAKMLRKHMSSMHSGFRFKCFVCDVVYVSLDALIIHQAKYLKSVVDEAESQFLRQRKSGPNRLYPYYCNFCGLGFTLIRLIASHKLAKHARKKEEDLSASQRDLEAAAGDADGVNNTSSELLHIGKANGFDNHQATTTALEIYDNLASRVSKDTDTTPQRSASTFLEFCELCGQKHTSLAAKRMHFHLQNFECVICRTGFNDLTQLAVHYDVSHAKYDVIRYEGTEMSFHNTHKYFCGFCGRGFYFINELLGHKEVDHYELMHTSSEQNNTDEQNCDRNNEQALGNNHLSNNNSNVNLESIFARPDATIPGLDIDDNNKTNDKENQNANAAAETNNGVVSMDISADDLVIDVEDVSSVESSHKDASMDSHTDNNLAIDSIKDISFANSSSQEEAEASDYATTDSHAGDLVIDLADVGSAESSQKEAENFMEVDEYLKERSVQAIDLQQGDKWDEAAYALADALTKEAILEDSYEVTNEPVTETTTDPPPPDSNQQPNLPLKTFCEACGGEFSSQETLRAHFTSIHGEKYFQCFVCGHGYDDITSLIQHQDVSHEVKILECAEKFTFSISQPKGGLLSFRYYCQSCGVGCDYIVAMKEHIKKTCCNLRGGANDERSDGVKRAKRKKNAVISCQNCWQDFQYWHQFNEHRVTVCPFRNLDNIAGGSTTQAVTDTTTAKNISSTEAKSVQKPVQLAIIDVTSIPPSAPLFERPRDINKKLKCPFCPNKYFGVQADYEQHAKDSQKHKTYVSKLSQLEEGEIGSAAECSKPQLSVPRKLSQPEQGKIIGSAAKSSKPQAPLPRKLSQLEVSESGSKPQLPVPPKLAELEEGEIASPFESPEPQASRPPKESSMDQILFRHLTKSRARSRPRPRSRLTSETSKQRRRSIERYIVPLKRARRQSRSRERCEKRKRRNCDGHEAKESHLSRRPLKNNVDHPFCPPRR